MKKLLGLITLIVLLAITIFNIYQVPSSRSHSKIKHHSKAEIAKMYESIVGHITTTYQFKCENDDSEYYSRGSALFVNRNPAVIMTNAHVVGKKTITVKDENGAEKGFAVIGSPTYEFENITEDKFPVKILKLDEENDLAYLMVDIATSEYNVAEIDYNYKPQRSKGVFIFTGWGDEKGGSYPFSFLEGIISNPEHFEPDSDENSFIQTTIQLISGNSGSPLIDLKTGKVIGIFAKGDENYSLAIPSKYFDKSFGLKK